MERAGARPITSFSVSWRRATISRSYVAMDIPFLLWGLVLLLQIISKNAQVTRCNYRFAIDRDVMFSVKALVLEWLRYSTVVVPPYRILRKFDRNDQPAKS